MVRRAFAAEHDADGARLTVRLMAGGLRWFPIVPAWSTGAFQNLTLLDSFLSLDGAESRADFRFSVGKASELDELRSTRSSVNYGPHHALRGPQARTNRDLPRLRRWEQENDRE